ncbi:AfsR/SARP family transcriptional regulator [Nocardia cyriacigeorgica]|uniref:AfsR/SARP family transcriptional regulator n=1 Tax=Nocardia cyriacigeorgica TaxID=135487 RepID=UPI00245772C6|nr:helix-turn-helix domain-containing protein [Nocardia cyriacigeorgica]
MTVSFGVLGPVLAWDADGARIDLKGPRHRAVLARLLVARGRVVPVQVIIDDLWGPGGGTKSAVRTFVAALRRALEPQRPARTAARLLVTEGTGYALRAEQDRVDAWRFERAVREGGGRAAPPPPPPPPPPRPPQEGGGRPPPPPPTPPHHHHNDSAAGGHDPKDEKKGGQKRNSPDVKN